MCKVPPEPSTIKELFFLLYETIPPEANSTLTTEQEIIVVELRKTLLLSLLLPKSS
jgi:hypothetical protein